jgi:hypothetical protein
VIKGAFTIKEKDRESVLSTQGKAAQGSLQCLFYRLIFRSSLFIAVLFCAFYVGYLAAAYFPEIWFLQPLVWLFIFACCGVFYFFSVSLEKLTMHSRVYKRNTNS